MNSLRSTCFYFYMARSTRRVFARTAGSILQYRVHCQIYRIHIQHFFSSLFALHLPFIAQSNSLALLPSCAARVPSVSSRDLLIPRGLLVHSRLLISFLLYTVQRLPVPVLLVNLIQVAKIMMIIEPFPFTEMHLRELLWF